VWPICGNIYPFIIHGCLVIGRKKTDSKKTQEKPSKAVKSVADNKKNVSVAALEDMEAEEKSAAYEAAVKLRDDNNAERQLSDAEMAAKLADPNLSREELLRLKKMRRKGSKVVEGKDKNLR
jgi:hypothetical protein